VKLLRERPAGRSRRIPAEQLTSVRHSVFRASGLRIDLDLLTDEEANELYALCQEIRAAGKAEGVVRSSAAVLPDKHRQRWERLVASAAALPADHFERQRKLDAAAKAEAEKKRRPKEHQTPWTAGTIIIPAPVWRGLQEGELGAGHLLLLTVILGCIESKCVPGRFGRVEDGVVIVPSIEHLIQPLDPDEYIRHPARALEELKRGGVLTIERANGEIRIGLGPTLSRGLGREARA
jgi:hypothetical protein